MSKTAMKVHSFKMKESEYEKADQQSRKKHGIPLRTLLRDLIYNEFPGVEEKDEIKLRKSKTK